MARKPKVVLPTPGVALNIHKPSMVPLGTLKRAAYNPRTLPESEREALRASFKLYGFVEPVVARAEDRLLAGGHQRLDVLEELLFAEGKSADEVRAYEVPCVLVPGLTDQRLKALNIALNRIGGEWAYDKLADVLKEIGSAVDIVTGFGEREVADILALVGGGSNVLPTRDPNEVLAAKARHFKFDVATDDEARDVVRGLQAFGMSGKKTASAALVAMARAALAAAGARNPE